MWHSRRTLKRNKPKRKLFFTITSLLILIVTLILISVFYPSLIYKKGSLLNPVSKNATREENNLGLMLGSKNIDFSNITTLPDSSFDITLKDGGTVIFSSKKDLEKQISSLQLILTRLTIEGKKFKILDFRYDNPVVSFN